MEEFDFFNKLTTDEQTYLIENSQYIELEQDFTLFYQGDICSDILLLQEGKVRLSIYGDVDEVVPLYEIQAGEQCIINTSSAISKTPTIATAKTLTPIKGRLVPSKIIEHLMLTSHSYQQFVFSFFALKFHALTTIIEDIKFKKLDTRILEYLKKQNTKIIKITHIKLADELGTSRVVISRVLKDLENKNFIKLYNRQIEIL